MRAGIASLWCADKGRPYPGERLPDRAGVVDGKSRAKSQYEWDQVKTSLPSSVSQLNFGHRVEDHQIDGGADEDGQVDE
jgi:hypothetical protein